MLVAGADSVAAAVAAMLVVVLAASANFIFS